MSQTPRETAPSNSDPTEPVRRDWFTLGAAGGFLGAVIAVGLPLWRRHAQPAAHFAEQVQVFEPEAIRIREDELIAPSQEQPIDSPSPPLPGVVETSVPYVTEEMPDEPAITIEEVEAPSGFRPGEIVRKGKALRKRFTDPDLGVVLQAFTGYEPVTYKVQFFDGEEGRRDIFWGEDLVRLNEREADLFLRQYPDEKQEEIRRHGRRAAYR